MLIGCNATTDNNNNNKTTDNFLLLVLYVFISYHINYDFVSCYHNKKATCTTFISMISNGHHAEEE